MEHMQKKNMKSNISTGEHDHDAPFVDDYLLYLMAQASNAISTAFHQQLADQGISVPKWRILASLSPDQTLNVGDLARRCLMKQPTLTRQLDRLCAAGLTHRTHAETDRRGVLISLTPKGQAQAQDLIALAQEHEAMVFKDYGQAQTETLKSVLHGLITHTRTLGG